MVQLNTELLGLSVYDVYKAGRKWGKRRRKLVEEKGKRKPQADRKRDWKKEQGEVKVESKETSRGGQGFTAIGGSKPRREAAIRAEHERLARQQGTDNISNTKVIPPGKMRAGGSEWKGGRKGKVRKKDPGDYTLHPKLVVEDQDANVRAGEQRAAGYIGGGRTAAGRKVFGKPKEEKKEPETDEEKKTRIKYELHLESIARRMGIDAKKFKTIKDREDKKKPKKKKTKKKEIKDEEIHTDESPGETLGGVTGATNYAEERVEEEDSSYDVHSEDPDDDLEKAIIKAFLKEKKDYGDKLTDEEQGMLEGDPDMKNRITDPETMDTFKKRESTRSGHKDNIETVTPHHGKLEAEYDRVRSGSKFKPTTIGGHKVGQPKERDIPLPRVAGTALDPESARHGTSGLGDERQTLGFMVADRAGEEGDMTPEEQDEFRQISHEQSHRMTMDKELAEKLRGKAEIEHKCTQCGERRPKDQFQNPLGRSRGICDSCNSAFLDPNDPEDAKIISYLETVENDNDLDERGTPSTTRKAEEGPGGMQMGAQRGLGHEAGYTQGSGESTQVTEVEEKNVEKGVPVGYYDDDDDDDLSQKPYPSKQRHQTRSGRKDEMEVQAYTTGEDEHLYDDVINEGDYLPKERHVPLSRVEGTSRSAEGERSPGTKVPAEVGSTGEKKYVTVSQLGDKLGRKEPSGYNALRATYAKEEAEKHKSAYENHEQDESPDSQPNKQQIPSSKVGMDAIKSRLKLLNIRYKNIYKVPNL